MTRKIIITALIAPIALAGCMATTEYTGGEPKLIARDEDRTFGDNLGPREGIAAVAITPDGCEAWIMDEGVEGYATTRSDPKTGLPVCAGLQAGDVVGDHTVSEDLPDYLPN
jgi:hypothetical protein